MNILFYTPMNTRCRDIESQAIEFKKRGHKIFLLTQSKNAELHQNFQSYGFSVSSTETSSSFSILDLFFKCIKFVSFCWKNKIGIVYSHLEPSNFTAVICQYFIRSRVIICRHHMDYAKLSGMDQFLSYKLTYRLARTIIVVSSQAKNYMIQEEKVPGDKIHPIRLAYNLELYALPDQVRVDHIKKKYPADVLLLTVGRLTALKRPLLSIQLLVELNKINVNVKLLILGEGELMSELKQLIAEQNLEDKVFLPGYVNNVLEYMAASDCLVHPSISESSCISIKEAGLVALPSIVCRGVGDFDEIIQDHQNGFLVQKDNFVAETLKIVTQYHADRSQFKKIGENIRNDVHDKFDIKKVSSYYEDTFHNSSK